MNELGRGSLRSLARLLSGVAAIIAALGLLGYATRQDVLVQVRPDLRGMSPLTALALLVLAVSVTACSWRRDRLARVTALVAGIVALATLIVHGTAGGDVLSPAIGAALFGAEPDLVGRTSIATGLSLLLLAGAVLFRLSRSFGADLASGGALLLASAALLGYLYGVSDLYALPMFSTMALNTAVALTLLSVGMLLVDPEAGWAGVIASDEIGGGATRRQLSFVALPVVAGWFLLRATREQGLGLGAAMALLVLITVVPLAVLVLRDGRVLNQLDRARRDKEEVQDRLTEDLERQLAAQAAELERRGTEKAQAEAALHRAQRMEAVGQLTGGIAHDFNNLLMAIRGNLELLDRRLPGGEDRARRYVENALAATDKGAKVTGQLLAFSRSQKLQVRPMEIDPVLVSARELIGSSLGPAIDIVTDLRSPGVWAVTDPDQLELAILNLAVNARDAMPEGGTLRIESGDCRARLSEEADESAYVLVRVTDTGTGMSDDVAAHAVEPFYTTKERDKGTGLGLAQVYGFVRQCGGDLRIVTAPGAGTTVEILLRCAEPAGKPGRAPSGERDRSQTPIARGQVLVVDDDDAVRAVIVDALSSVGFTVLEANGGEQGLALLQSETPVAAVIDFLMPGMNGAEVARRIQQDRPGLPIVFVSGYSDTVALDGISGAVVLRKPFDMLALDRAISSVLH